jgi:tartrate-resistant acid phosphatase type 5
LFALAEEPGQQNGLGPIQEIESSARRDLNRMNRPSSLNGRSGVSDEHDEQQHWLEAELEKPRSTPFLALAAHHPLYSNGKHRDNPKPIARWDSLLRRQKVDLYLSGHDHDLQHHEFEGHPTSVIISGGGGAEPVGWTTSPEERGPWGLRAVGFTGLQISKEELVIRHIGKDASVLYEFKKPLNITGRT